MSKALMLKWISSKNNPPTDSGDYLVTCEKADSTRFMQVVSFKIRPLVSFWDTRENVIAWTSLPAEYEGE